MPAREIQTCTRCKDSKRRCDKRKPSCTRCHRAGQTCIYPENAPKENSIEHQTGLLSPSSSSHPSPLETESAPGRLVKKRDRATLSCTRCHRLKVKCDKRQPCCSRCSRLGHGRDCMYTHKIEPPTSAGPFVVDGDDAETIVSLWFLRKRGSSHWKILLTRLESLSGLGDPPFQWLSISVRAHMQGDCSKDLALPGNFPFGSTESIPFRSPPEVQRLIESHRHMASSYLESYFALYACTQLFDNSKFQEEVHQFWHTPEKFDLSWLAQYLAVLGLGASATGVEDKVAAELFFASEACLAQTPYMYRSTVANIRTLFLHVQAKQVCYATCWALDASWNVVGLIVRLSIMMGLHRSWIPEPDEMPSIFEERVQRKRLWNAVVKMDIQTSLVTGQASPLPADAFLANALDNIQGLPHNSCDLIPASYPLIYEILTRLNTSMEMISYEEVMHYDTEVRRIMRLAIAAAENESYVMRTTTDIFFRRVLMVLHRYYALDPDAPNIYPTSYWSSLECCLALIVHQRAMMAQCGALPGNVHLVARPFMLDFFAAALTTCIHLLSVDAPLSTTVGSANPIPPRRTIVETLESCLEIFARESSHSVCFGTGYRLMSVVFGLVPKCTA
ncbi:hypothetical protein DPSP01_011312 [Paraphaeosphaeria sporulosa]